MKKLLIALLLTAPLLSSFAQKSTEFHLDETYAMNSAGTIELLSDDAEVTIIGESRTDVAVIINRVAHQGGVRIGDEEFSVEVKRINGDLHIIEHSQSSGEP